MQDVYARLTNHIASILGVEKCAIFLYDEESNELVCQSPAYGVAEELVPSLYLSLSEGSIARMLWDRFEPFVADDVMADPSLVEYRPQFAALQLKSILAKDLRIEGKHVGTVIAGNKISGGGFDENDVKLLTILVEHAAFAIEKERLYQAEQKWAREIQALYEIGQAITTQMLDVQKLAETIRDQVGGLMDTTVFHLALYGDDERRYTWHFLTSDGQRQSPTVSPPCTAEQQTTAAFADWVSQHRQSLLLRDLETEDQRCRELGIELAKAEGGARFPRSYLGVPLLVRDRFVGILAVQSCVPNAYDEGDQRLLSTIANQVAAAVENARVYAEAEEKAAELAVLLDAVTTLSSTLAIDDALMVLAEQMVSALQITLGSISLLDEADESLKVQAGHALRNLGWQPPLGQTIKLADAPAHRRVIEEQTAVLFRQDYSDQMICATELEAALMPGIQSGALLPLLVGGRVLGVISLGELRKWERTPFTADKLRLCQAMASQAAIAIEKAQLYQTTLEEKRKTETILEETFGGIMVIAPDMTVAMINRGVETILGYDAADIVGCHLSELFDQELWDDASLVQQAINRGERVPPQETSLIGRWGRRDVLMGVTPLYDTEGHVFSYLVSLADITHLKEVDRLKSEIVANVSHELRTPLASIKAYTELLLDNLDEGDPDLRSHFLGIIDQETDRLATLISDLLDISRLESGRFEMQRELLRLEDLIEDVLSRLRLEAQVKGLDIHVRAVGTVALFWGDRELMTMLIKNLVSNAVKFSHPGGRVDIEVIYGEYHLALTVTDRGIGIPEEAIPHLFEKFYRVHSTTESGIEGTGLGLVLAKQAAEAHGGTIEVKSKLGQGSRFIVTLPLSYEGLTDGRGG